MTVQQALASLLAVRDRWPDLEQARLRGTARPWRQTEMTAQAKAQRDRQARIEKVEAEKWGRAPGYSAAPLHVDVLDTMAAILIDADLLHEAIAQTVGHPRLEHPATAYADPRPYLEYALELLTEAVETNPKMGERAEQYATAMETALLIALGELRDGQILNAICPFCVGKTFEKPAGERTLRLRLVPDHRDQTKTEAVIVCENPSGCRPFAAECGIWVKGRPAWPWSDWDWLAKRLLPAS